MLKLNSIHKVFIVALISFVFFNCESSKNTSQTKSDDMVNKIVFSKTTLGNNFEMIVNKENIITAETQRGGETQNHTQKTSEMDWTELNRIISELNLSEFENLPAPTQERFHDGARATTIILEMADKTTLNSLSYDEGNPPVELKKLNDYLESLVNQ